MDPPDLGQFESGSPGYRILLRETEQILFRLIQLSADKITMLIRGKSIKNVFVLTIHVYSKLAKL